MIKSIGDIRLDVTTARRWLSKATGSLDWVETADLALAKQELQEAKKLIDEAIVDLDGLVQDAKTPEANGIDPAYEAYQASQCGGCSVCPQDGPGYGEEPWWM